MKTTLDKTGLRLMVLGIAIAVVYSFVASYIMSSVPQFNILVFCELVLPAIFVTGMTLLDRLFGGLLAAVVSALVLVPISYLFSSRETTPDFGLFAIIICFLLGGVCILTSLAMRAPRKANNKA